MTVDRVAYVHWFTSAIHTITVYHSHKENMAWLATALYIGVAPTAILKVSPTTPLERWWVVVLILLFTFLVGLFVVMQFRNRAIASDVVNALMITLNKFCADSDFSPADTGKLSCIPRYYPQVAPARDTYPHAPRSNGNQARI